MASTGVNAKELRSWQEAFTYPLSTTRQIEKQLRDEVAADKERLRTLVGASYRDLLGTADRIIDLDELMQEAERLLGDVSLQCNLDSINKIMRQLAVEQEQRTQQKAGRRHLVAQLSLLQRCQKCLPRLFRQGGSILTAAKILAVSRLLDKRISQGEDAPPLLESIRRQLASHRRRLLRKVDLILVSPKSGLEELTDSMCAFCIVASSSSSDAMRHFHDLRINEIRRLSSPSEQGPGDVLSAFDYYLQSTRATAQLLGRHLPDATRDLGSRPILLSPDIQSLEELDLTSVQPFIPAEILSFVPWIKQPDGGEVQGASSVLEKWSELAFSDVCLGLQRAVEALADAFALLDFRNRVLHTWLPICVSTPTHSNSGVLEALRDIVNRRMKDLLHGEAESLSAITSEIESALGEDELSMLTTLPIWDHDFVTAPVGRGVSYKEQLTDRHLSQSKTTKTIFKCLQKWMASVSTSAEKIQQVRKARWIDVIEEGEDEDDDEDDDDKPAKMERLLQRDDPGLYEQEHESSLRTAILQLQNRTKEAADNLSTGEGRKAMFLLRTIRGIHHHIAISFPQQDLTVFVNTIPHLHQLLASNITTSLLEPMRSSPSSLVKKSDLRALGQLWEGDPPLPPHPPPRVFDLLGRLTTLMADQGADLWSSDAVDTLKRTVRKGMMDRRLLRPWSGDRPGSSDTRDRLVNGHKSRDRGTRYQVLIQILFDLLYLSHALRLPEEEGDLAPDTDTDTDTDNRTISSLLQHFKEVASMHLDPTAMKTLETRAREYWIRTNLLFGLLA